MKTVVVVFDQLTVNLPHSVHKHLQNKSQSLRRAIFPTLATIKRPRAARYSITDALAPAEYNRPRKKRFGPATANVTNINKYKRRNNVS